MKHEHIRFYYVPLSYCKRGLMLEGCQMVTLRSALILPVVNTEEIPENLPMGTQVCLQEVIDESNKHVLIFFNVTNEHNWE